MQYLQDEQEIYDLYTQAKLESEQWREDYHEFERLADNDLIEDLDPSLPEVNDGSLAASLFKLPKRIVNTDLKGRATTTDRDDVWLTELANIQWENNIIPNANSQAPFHRKWKDAVRKAAIYGSVPLISLFVERGDYVGADFIVAQPQDVTLEPGKVSDNDSDIFFWDVYFTKIQMRQMIERAKAESKDKSSFNKWNIKALEEILASNDKEERTSDYDHKQRSDKSVKQQGFKFCVVFQRGVKAPFYMYHSKTKTTVREWENQDPTGDVPVHFLYCYQDLVNPYGIGIVKLAGGTQNVLDYMRQADVLATQMGFRPPVSISGDIDSADLDSIVYEQDAQWYVGNANVRREEISNQVYAQLPDRMSMYKTSLNQMIPTGDTSISASAGDPNYSKTPAGVKFQAQNLSIDDDDFKDNLYITYEAVSKSLINIHFANMQGTDLMKLTDEERDLLTQGGLEFPLDEDGVPTNELEVIWDEVRATFDFEIDAEQDKAKDDELRLENLMKVAELRASDPTIEQSIMMNGKKLNVGELFTTIIELTADNDKIITDIAPEEMEAMQAQQMGMEQMGDEMGAEPMGQPMGQPTEQVDPQAQQDMINLQAVMQEYGVDEETAMGMLEAEKQGFEPEEIQAGLLRKQNV